MLKKQYFKGAVLSRGTVPVHQPKLILSWSHQSQHALQMQQYKTWVQHNLISDIEEINKKLCKMHCISTIIDNLYKHHTKIPLCSRELLQTSYLTVPRHHECLKSKCAQIRLHLNSWLAFGQAGKQPKSNCFFFLGLETTTGTSEFCPHLHADRHCKNVRLDTTWSCSGKINEESDSWDVFENRTSTVPIWESM